ncbi:hypothetical protein EVAR_96802_1 [Eumeta japonica]|uniref:Uncharacterized protein n=1 Tax=Eumeta variegata TaxID=151549 RepID=A0A4C1WDG6_EUMVA|nr:hypothetical protein EVAR_96802_1 [Eumeta japonica]
MKHSLGALARCGPTSCPCSGDDGHYALRLGWGGGGQFMSDDSEEHDDSAGEGYHRVLPNARARRLRRRRFLRDDPLIAPTQRSTRLLGVCTP